MALLNTLLEKATNEELLSLDEMLILLQLESEADRQLLFAAARKARTLYFSDRVALYGFVYFSTYCRNDCSFCLYRKSNTACERYRKTTDEIVAASVALAESGTHLIDLTMGEDPYYLNGQDDSAERLVEIVRAVRQHTGLPIMISPGVVSGEILVKLQDAGATWYACYQETHNRQLFADLRLHQNYDQRWSIKLFAKSVGMLVEEGLLVGIGDQVRDAAHSLLAMRELEAAQVRAMTFVPQAGTPLAALPKSGSDYELNLIAVMRLLFPDCCIPASLDVEGIQGLKNRLNAGANVVTSIIPPASGLQGVSQSTLDIDEGYRTVAGVLPILESCGLTPATSAEYTEWMDRLQHRVVLEEVQ
jgi:methylornithine synthase